MVMAPRERAMAGGHAKGSRSRGPWVPWSSRLVIGVSIGGLLAIAQGVQFLSTRGDWKTIVSGIVLAGVGVGVLLALSAVGLRDLRWWKLHGRKR